MGPGYCRLGLAVDLGLLSIWCIRLSGSRRSGSGLLCLLLSLPSRRCSGLRFHLFASLTNPDQTVLTPSQLIGQIAAELPLAVALVVLGIEDLRPAHQGVDLLLQFLLSSEHPLVAHGFVLGGISFHLGAIQRHMTQADHPGLLAEAEDLNKQILEGIKIAAAKLTDAAVVRLLVAGEHPAGQILITGPLDLAGGDDAHAVGVEQQHRHHPGIKPFFPTGLLGLCGPKDLREIQFIHQIQQEVHLVIAGKPLTG